MPKRSTARSRTQRQKAKAQKHIELVRSDVATQEPAAVEILEAPESTEEHEEERKLPAATDTTKEKKESTRATSVAVAKSEEAAEETTSRETETKRKLTSVAAKNEKPVTASQNSASASLAARRQGAQRAQRSAPSLLSPEHFAHVRRDLITVAILASLMLVILIVLYFVLAAKA
ncbi:MAG: hypothetical protein IMW89_04715 [Ktedonobacteraceae bacterium]|nr:hypothetical protein [Ktedonobacteraceae bacterium]